MQQINTISSFVDCVNNLDDVSLAYDLFEFDCTDQLRDQIYSLASQDSAEPFREAMHLLGFVNY